MPIARHTSHIFKQHLLSTLLKNLQAWHRPITPSNSRLQPEGQKRDFFMT